MEEAALVERRALVERHGPAHALHLLHGEQEQARAVVADERLGEGVRHVGRGGGANLQAGDAHHVRVHRLRVLRAERLVRGGAASADDGHRHLELAARGGVRVARARELSHAVDAKVEVHELHNRTVPVHPFPERLAEEVALVDNLVRSPQAAERLLRAGGYVVRGARLEVLRVRHRHRVAEHLLEDGEVDGVAEREPPALGFVALGLEAERLDARLDLLDGGGLHRGGGDLLRLGEAARGLARGVVHRARGVGVLEVGGERRGRRGRRFRKVEARRHALLHLRLDGGNVDALRLL
mmetsp:Transcript_9790/g.32079  ORF Transcript_9790/g.32079 Transcript_9790/m.32079 type:complete len:296 (-) Transcript_9790:1103-1990(-)